MKPTMPHALHKLSENNFHSSELKSSPDSRNATLTNKAPSKLQISTLGIYTEIWSSLIH